MNLFLNFLMYLGVGCLLLLIGTLVFVITTKEREFALIKEKNTAAALSLSGKIFGLAFVLGSSVANSINVLDMIVWGIIGILAQIIVYYIAELVTVKFSISKAIQDNNNAIGILLFTLSISIGWIIAQCMTY
ncbi:DUF350 domain-containing protein [Priestia filamentosa]|uniref:DUF350 domain-containing protein n=1 Tax=Priestia filamentosa TaxID=1402861 RepID=UPI0005894D17